MELAEYDAWLYLMKVLHSIARRMLVPVTEL